MDVFRLIEFVEFVKLDGFDLVQCPRASIYSRVLLILVYERKIDHLLGRNVRNKRNTCERTVLCCCAREVYMDRHYPQYQAANFPRGMRGGRRRCCRQKVRGYDENRYNRRQQPKLRNNSNNKSSTRRVSTLDKYRFIVLTLQLLQSRGKKPSNTPKIRSMNNSQVFVHILRIMV